jgi:hypothetical protein
MGKVSRRKLKKERFERRFAPASTVDRRIVMLLGGLGAAALGAGFWGQWGAALGSDADPPPEPVKYAIWILVIGAAMVATAIWIGTSTEPVIRVGTAGIGEEKSAGVRRIPWHALEHLDMEDDVLVVRGKDETGAACTIRVRRATAPQAVAWIASETRTRVPKVYELKKAEEEKIGEPSKLAGEWAEPPPLQVVGKHCAVSGKVIAYEPDARVCPRCELVYHKNHVPKTCACGNSLTGLREQS